MLILSVAARLRSGFRVLVVEALARVGEAWVHAFAIGGKALEDKGGNPGYRASNRTSCCSGACRVRGDMRARGFKLPTQLWIAGRSQIH
jgi:hypothetical protein